MSTELNLDKIEKKVYLSYHQDGLWDIFLGIFFFATGILWVFDQVVFAGIVPAVMLPSAINIKKSFAQSRLGYAKFSPERKAKEKKGVAGLVMVFTLTAIAGAVCFLAFTDTGGMLDWIKDLGLIPFGATLAFVTGAIGLMFGIRRLLLYALLILAVFVAGHMFNSDPPVYFLFLGLIFLIVGIVMLIQFMRKYPRVTGEVPYGG
jgi:hypothetical protein